MEKIIKELDEQILALQIQILFLWATTIGLVIAVGYLFNK